MRKSRVQVPPEQLGLVLLQASMFGRYAAGAAPGLENRHAGTGVPGGRHLYLPLHQPGTSGTGGLNRFGGGSSTGRAPGCGPGGRGFDSRPSPGNVLRSAVREGLQGAGVKSCGVDPSRDHVDDHCMPRGPNSWCSIGLPASVAHRIARRISTPRVAGSNPARGAEFFVGLQCCGHRLCGRVVRQRSAKPCTPVRIRSETRNWWLF